MTFFCQSLQNFRFIQTKFTVYNYLQLQLSVNDSISLKKSPLSNIHVHSLLFHYPSTTPPRPHAIPHDPQPKI